MVSKVVVSGLCFGLGLACLLTPRKATAWEALQLTLNGTAFSYQKTTFTNDADFAPSASSASATTSTTRFGFIGQGFGAGVGYAWKNILIGARAQVWSSSTSESGGGPSVDSSTIALLPRLEYIFAPGHTSPYLAAILGIEHDSLTQAASASASQSNTQTVQSGTQYLYGAAFGVHAFVDSAVSIDPELAIIGGSGSLNETSATGAEDSFSESDVRVMLTLGLSGWLGARKEEPAACIQEPAASPPPPPQNAPELDADEVKPLFTTIHLPGHRRLYVQVSQDPAHTALIIRLSEARTEAALATCDDISVTDTAGTLKMRVRSHGEHFVAGVIAPHAVELLANSNALISVCGEQWTLGTESREELQTFLKERHALQEPEDDGKEPAAAPAAPLTPTGTTPNSAPPVPAAPQLAPATPTGSAAFPAPPALTPKTK